VDVTVAMAVGAIEETMAAIDIRFNNSYFIVYAKNLMYG